MERAQCLVVSFHVMAAFPQAFAVPGQCPVSAWCSARSVPSDSAHSGILEELATVALRIKEHTKKYIFLRVACNVRCPRSFQSGHCHRALTGHCTGH